MVDVRCGLCDQFECKCGGFSLDENQQNVLATILHFANDDDLETAKRSDVVECMLVQGTPGFSISESQCEITFAILAGMGLIELDRFNEGEITFSKCDALQYAMWDAVPPREIIERLTA